MIRRRTALPVLLCAVFLLGVPALASAEPGRPGLDSAAAGVYPMTDDQSLGGVETGGPESGGQPSQDTGAVNAATASGGDSGLPFTGLAAVLVLGAGVLLLGAGALIRVVGRRAGNP
jgi:hypothetical protein